jgi:hypothetical protein
MSGWSSTTHESQVNMSPSVRTVDDYLADLPAKEADRRERSPSGALRLVLPPGRRFHQPGGAYGMDVGGSLGGLGGLGSEGRPTGRVRGKSTTRSSGGPGGATLFGFGGLSEGPSPLEAAGTFEAPGAKIWPLRAAGSAGCSTRSVGLPCGLPVLEPPPCPEPMLAFEPAAPAVFAAALGPAGGLVAEDPIPLVVPAVAETPAPPVLGVACWL